MAFVKYARVYDSRSRAVRLEFCVWIVARLFVALRVLCGRIVCRLCVAVGFGFCVQTVARLCVGLRVLCVDCGKIVDRLCVHGGKIVCRV